MFLASLTHQRRYRDGRSHGAQHGKRQRVLLQPADFAHLDQHAQNTHDDGGNQRHHNGNKARNAHAHIGLRLNGSKRAGRARLDAGELGTQAASVINGDDLYCVAAMDGDKKAALISNLGDEREITTNLCSCMKAYLIDQDHLMTEAELDPKKFTLGKNQVVYFKNF